MKTEPGLGLDSVLSHINVLLFEGQCVCDNLPCLYYKLRA